VLDTERSRLLDSLNLPLDGTELSKPNAKRKTRKKKPAKKKRGPGRPTKYTPETVTAIINAIMDGNYKAVAARIAGVSRDTLYEWESRYPEFSDAIKNAEAVGEAEHVARIKRGPMQWQSSAWFLERKYPDRWGKRERRDTGEGEKVERYVPNGSGSYDRVVDGDNLIGHHDEVDTPST